MKTLYVHGGVSGTAKPPYDLAAAVTAGLLRATALDIVEAAVRVLEDDEGLNAGFGSVLTIDGTVELDAGIADGSRGTFGAVIGVSVANPITLARRVLDQTPHVMLAGAGASRLGEDMPQVAVSQTQVDAWKHAVDEGHLEPENFGVAEQVDTVGAVAVDDNGVAAAGSSTGGVRGKMRGRVGDSPVFGAGYYASGSAAVVATGVGERFLETLACERTGRAIDAGTSPQDACEEVIRYMGHRSDNSAGLLAVDAEGRVGAAYRGASWSIHGPDGFFTATRLE